MMCVNSDIVQRLNQFKHGSRTNIAKRVMTNRDAIALILAMSGPMSLKNIRDTMMTWRQGQANYEYVLERRYVVTANRVRQKVRKVLLRPTMSFSAYFSFHNSFSQTGKVFDAAPLNVCHSVGYWTPGGWVTHVRFKRTPYWFRLSRGHYAVTAGGLKRLCEVGLM